MNRTFVIIFFIVAQNSKGTRGLEICDEIPEDICPNTVSEYTGEWVKQLIKYLPRDHPAYDVKTPDEGRDIIKLYCAPPACDSQPCLNGGTCSEELEGFSCTCPAGYNGTRCEIEICPGDWVYGVTKCFLFDGDKSRNWQEAHDFCDGLDAVTLGNGDVIGPSLAFLENPEEFALSKTHLPNSWVWSNCNKLNINAPWVCVTDRAGTTSPYRDWGPGQPEDDSCVISYKDQMHDQDCNTKSRTGTSCQVNISA